MYLRKLTIILLAVSLQVSFAFAATPTPTPTPTATHTNTPTPTPTPDLRGLTPVGAIMLYTSSTAPTGWLFCNGTAVSRATYAYLFSVISVVYGAGDGSTTFNLPDFQGRTPLGYGHGSGLSIRNFGDILGEETHTLTITEMPPHTHSVPMSSAGNGSAGGITVRIPTGSTTSGSTGGGAAFTQFQPSFVVAYYIYAGTPLDIAGATGVSPILETSTPDGLMVYSTVQYGSSTQNVALRYEISAGDIMVTIVLLMVAALLCLKVVLDMRRTPK